MLFFFIFLLLPFTLLETGLWYYYSFSKVLLKSFLLPSLLFLIFFGICLILLKKGRHLANILILFYILALFSGLLVIILQAKQLYLGFYCLALCVYVFFLFFLLRHEKNRSFWAPPWKWYQGLPESIPHLKCEVFQGEKKEILKVCRLDAEGSFLFNNLHTSLIQLDVRRLVELVFRFKDKKVRCRGIVKKVLYSDLGVGIQFCNISPDTQKELGDFVELLKGEGYVS